MRLYLFVINFYLKNLFENRMLIFTVFLHKIVILKKTHEMTSLCGISRTNIKKHKKILERFCKIVSRHKKQMKKNEVLNTTVCLFPVSIIKNLKNVSILNLL